MEPYMRCPSCRNELNEEKNPSGVYYSCSKCGGRSVSLYLLQKLGMPQDLFALLNDAAKTKPESFARECPNCRKKMTKCKLPIGEGLMLDICGVCRQIWFDPSEFQALHFEPPKPPPSNELPQECKVAMALAMVKKMEEDREREANYEKASSYSSGSGGIYDFFSTVIDGIFKF